MTNLLRAAAVVWLLLVGSGSAWAQIDPIPKTSGFSGFAQLGVMYLDLQSNMVAGNEVYNVGNSTISSLTASPGSSTDMAPIINFDLRYTFASTRTQVFLGNSLEDFLRMDQTTMLGVRQGVSEKSNVSASVVFSSFPAEVWADPYVVNAPRQDVDRENTGVRLNWDWILDSGFGIQYTYRNIDLDRELSGLTQLGLPAAQAALLNREGTNHRAEVTYLWNIAPGHSLIPAYRYTKLDLDGDAMANDRHSLQLTYAYRGDSVTVVANIEYAKSDYDAVNPIYLTTRDDDYYGGGVQLFWHEPFGAPKGLSLLGSVAAFNSDSNIDFYDEKLLATGISVFYKF